MTYEELLEKAYKKIKHSDVNHSRFEVPKIESSIQGKKIIINNFSQIAKYLRRDIAHFQKFILKELATSGQLEGNKLILNTKVSNDKLNLKVGQYIDKFVKCRECEKPDTELIKENRLLFVYCLACGAKYSVR